ncbi:ATP-dependent DNA helicase [Abortiporus biennis]|nr:ATP-dependent DNA helicase [Abortiporus biennis]
MGVDKAREIRKDLLLILRNKFRLQEFRPNQREAIEAALTGHDVFVLMPTGGGKSLCFQAAALCQLGKTRGVTVVVCPLVALMADQLRALHEKNIDVVAFSGSSSGAEDYEDPTARLYSKEKPSLLYCTPEKLDKNQHSRRVLQHLHKTGNLARFVIDEAHCISVWGRNFRDAYKKLGSLRQEYPGVPIMTLTATASPLCENDIIKIMGIEGCVRIAQSFNRPNLIYEVRLKKKDVVADIIKYIQQKHPTHTGVIYCNSRRQCEEVAAKLRKDGISAKHYHAELDPEDKKRVQTEWQCGKCKVIVATIAFGMGIDKADVRFVIHHTMPRRLDGYYQETGRAGRDGEPADCLCYSAYGDFISLQRQIREDETLSAEAREHAFGELERVFSYCQNDVDCRRSQVLSYFGEDFKKEVCKGGCDNCLGVFDTVEEDLTEAARIAIRLLERVSSSQVSKTAYTDLLSQNLKAQNHKLNKDIVNRLYEKLVEMRIFETESYSNNAGWNTNKIVVSIFLGASSPRPAENDAIQLRSFLRLELRPTPS